MFKDFNKFLFVNLKVYFFVLLIIIIMKLVGINYFGLDVNNAFLINAEHFLRKTYLLYAIDFATLYLMFYVYITIVCDNKDLKFVAFIATLIEFIGQFLLLKVGLVNQLKCILDFIIAFGTPIIINKKIKIKRPFIIICLIILYQIISYATRGQIPTANYENKIIDFLLNIDQYILLIFTYKIYFEGGVNLCHQEVGSSSQKKINFSILLRKLQESLYKFKQQDKETKITYIIYFILSLFWNCFTIVFILLMARLNGTLIECLFIIFAFWITKTVFGEAFHLESMLRCFVLSSLVYYIFNRITLPIKISVIVPIILGVGLSYFTSKLVKKTYKPLYRGMPENLFNETILKVVDKGSDKYNICYDYFVLKKNAIALGIKYNYSDSGIKKIKDRVNLKIKELNN